LGTRELLRIMRLRFFDSNSSSNPSHPSQRRRRVGHPQNPTLNSGVNGSSGISRQL
jgi:hypothetical protein